MRACACVRAREFVLMRSHERGKAKRESRQDIGSKTGSWAGRRRLASPRHPRVVGPLIDAAGNHAPHRPQAVPVECDIAVERQISAGVPDGAATGSAPKARCLPARQEQARGLPARQAPRRPPAKETARRLPARRRPSAPAHVLEVNGALCSLGQPRAPTAEPAAAARRL